MERLTIKKGLCGMASTEFCHSQEDCYSCEYGRKCFRTLAAYEDTGLEPERVAELAQAEKGGRLVVLPCKVVDKVWTNFAMSGWYFRDKDRPYSARVVFVGLNDSDKMGRGLINVVYGKHDYMMRFSFSEIGKTVFLTRQEAEEVLRKEAENG